MNENPYQSPRAAGLASKPVDWSAVRTALVVVVIVMIGAVLIFASVFAIAGRYASPPW